MKKMARAYWNMPGKKKELFFIMLLGAICFFHSPLWALEVETALQPDTIGLNDTAMLKIIITGAKTVEPMPLPSLKDIELEYAGSVQGANMVNFDVTRYYVLQYRIVPAKEGVFSIPPLNFTADGKKYASKPVQVTVKKNISRRPPRTRDPFSFRSRFRDAFEEPEQEQDIIIEAESDFIHQNYYPGQPIFVRYFIYSNKFEYLDIKGFESFPELKGLIRNNVEENIPDEPLTRNGKMVTKKHLMTLMLLPTSKGVFEIGGGRLLAVLSTGSFFSSGRKKYITFTPQKVTVLPLPEKGRPNNYSGNVGDFSILLNTHNFQSQQYQEIVIDVVIKGKGNFSTLSAPDFEHEPGPFKIIKSEGSLQQEKNDSPLKGQKVFTFTLIPEEKGDFSLGRISFNFFNPWTRHYAQVSTDEIKVQVTGAGGSSSASLEFDSKSDKGSNSFLMLIAVLSLILVFVLVLIILIVVRWERNKHAAFNNEPKEQRSNNHADADDSEPNIDQAKVDELFKKELLYTLHKGKKSEYLNIANKIIAYLIKEKLADREDRKAELYSLQNELLQYRYGGGSIDDQLLEKVRGILLQYL